MPLSDIYARGSKPIAQTSHHYCYCIRFLTSILNINKGPSLFYSYLRTLSKSSEHFRLEKEEEKVREERKVVDALNAKLQSIYERSEEEILKVV